MSKDLTQVKAKLQAEYEQLVEELQTVGRVNPDNPYDWQATPPEHDEAIADPNDAADVFEDYEANTAILKQLEIRFNKVKNALEKIDTGTYGLCEKCRKPIEEARLEADAAAPTCKAHME